MKNDVKNKLSYKLFFLKEDLILQNTRVSIIFSSLVQIELTNYCMSIKVFSMRKKNLNIFLNFIYLFGTAQQTQF